MRLTKRVWLTLFALACAALPLAGQDARGTLLGRVTDSSDALIVGAAVKASNTQTGVQYTSITNSSGDYMLPFLIPGSYTITVEMQGFETSTRTGIAVRESDRITIDVTMQVGEASDSIQVPPTPLVDTSTASMGQVVESRDHPRTAERKTAWCW